MRYVHVLIPGEKVSSQCCSKLLVTKRWVMEIVRQRIVGHRANNWKCLTTELAATMSCNDELVAAGSRAKMLTAQWQLATSVGVQQSTRYWSALLWRYWWMATQVYTGYVQEHPASAAQSDATVSVHGRTYYSPTDGMSCRIQHPLDVC